MGKYINPVVYKLNKLQEENNMLKTGKNTNEVAKENENIISLDSILNEKEKIETELIDYPKISKIVGKASSISLSSNDLGILSIKYSNFNSEKNHQIMM